MPSKNNGLGIKIVAKLNTGASIGEINSAIKGLEKKINKLKLNVTLDNNVIKVLGDFSKAMEKNKKLAHEMSQVKLIDPKDVSDSKKFFTSIEDIKKQFKEIGNVNIRKVFDPVTNEVKSLNVEIQRADGLIERLKFEMAQLKGVHGVGNGFLLTGRQEVDKTATQIERARLQSIQRRQEEERRLAEAQARAINRNIEETQRLNRQEEERTRELQHQLDLFRRQAQVNVDNQRRRYGSAISEEDNRRLDEYLRSVNGLTANTPNVRRQMQDLNMQFREISSNVRTASNRVMGFGEQLQIAMTRFPIWMVASTAFYSVIRSLTYFYDTLVMIDKQLVSIQKVVGDIDISTTLDRATESAYEFGRTIDGALKSIETISKLGFDIGDAQSLSDNALMLATVGEMLDEDAANYLVAILRQYKFAVEDMSDVVDVLNELSNKTGATTNDLAAGLSRSSAAANTAKVSFNELASMIASTTETLRISGQEAGNFYKTLFTRMLRSSTLSDLEAIGVQVKDTNGELLSATEILRQTSLQWQRLSSTQQNAIAQSLGGVYHINKVTSLLENQESVAKYTTYAMESYGSAANELKTYEEGLEFQTNQLKASLQELAMTIAATGGQGGLEMLIDFAKAMVQGFNDLTEATDGWNIKLPVLAGAIYGLVRAFQALVIAASGAKLSLGWIGIGIVALETITSAFLGVKRANEVNSDAMLESAKATAVSANQLENLYEKYLVLEKEAGNNAEKHAELQQVLEDIRDIAPSLVKHNDDYTLALDANAKKVEEYANHLRSLSEEQLKQAQIANSINLSNARSELEALNDEVQKFENRHKEDIDKMLAYEVEHNVSTLREAEQALEKEVAKFKKEFDSAVASGNDQLAAEIEEKVQLANLAYQEYYRIKDNADKEFSDYSELIESRNTLLQQVDIYKQQADILDGLSKDTSQLGETNEKLSGTLDDGADVASEFTNEMESLGEEVDELVKTFEKHVGNISNLNSVINELNDGHGLSSDSIQFLMENYEQFLPYLDDEVALRDLIQQQIVEEERLAKQAILAKLQYNEQFYQNVLKGNQEFVKSFNQMYGVDLNNFKNLASAKLAVDNALRSQLAKAWAKFHNVQASMAARHDPNFRFFPMMEEIEYGQIYSQATNTFDNIFLDAIDLGGSIRRSGLDLPSSSRGKSGSKSSKDKASEKQIERYISDKYSQAIDTLNTKLEQSNAKLSDLYETSAAYRKELQNQVSIQQQMVSLTEKEIASLTKKNTSLKNQLSSMGNFNKLSNEQKEKYNEIAKEIDDNTKAINDLRVSTINYKEEIQNLEFSIIQSEINWFQKSIDNLSNSIDRNNKILGLYDKNSKEYLRVQEQIITQLDRKAKYIKQEEKAIQDTLRTEDLSIKQKEELKAILDDLSSAYLDVTLEMKNMQDEMENSIKDSLQSIKDEYIQGLSDELDRRRESIQKQIDSTNDYYDNLIEQQQKRLELLDEEIEKEDRLKQLREIEEEMRKVRNDTRFSYITAEGEEILTYDKARYNELEQQRQELIQQYQREDLRNAIENEIKQLEQARDRRIELLNQELEEVEEKYGNLIEQEEKRWDDLIVAVEEGTAKLDETLTSWYGKNLEGLSGYVEGVRGKVNELVQLFTTLSSLSTQVGSISSGINNAGLGLNPNDKVDPNAAKDNETRLKTDPAYLQSELERTRQVIENRKEAGLDTSRQEGYLRYLDKFHEGGIIGRKGNRLSELANKLLNSKLGLKPNEIPLIGEKGEVVLGNRNIPTMFQNVNKLINSIVPKQPSVIQSGDTITIHSMTVKANNPQQFMNEFQTFIRMYKP